MFQSVVVLQNIPCSLFGKVRYLIRVSVSRGVSKHLRLFGANQPRDSYGISCAKSDGQFTSPLHGLYNVFEDKVDPRNSFNILELSVPY